MCCGWPRGEELKGEIQLNTEEMKEDCGASVLVGNHTRMQAHTHTHIPTHTHTQSEENTLKKATVYLSLGDPGERSHRG